jgi:uncharacterized protein DUF6869/uncharacterized protein DUF4339
MTLDIRSALSSPDISSRLDAVVELTRAPDVARPGVAALVVAEDAPVLARVWAMLTICLIKDDSEGLAARALVQSATAAEGIVRRCAIDTLGYLKVDWAVAAIAEHLTDHETIDGGWFDDDSTPAEAARRALESIGTPDALRALASYPGPTAPGVSISARQTDAWYYRDAQGNSERRGGPIAFEQLVELIRRGELPEDVLVSSGMEDWQEADTMEKILRAIPIDRERIIREYIEYGEADNPEWGWASDRMYGILDGAPEIAWEIIVELIDRAPSDGALSFFAAGPLQDLLSKDGRCFIDRVVWRSANNEQFRRAIGMLRGLGRVDEVWARVQAIALSLPPNAV